MLVGDNGLAYASGGNVCGQLGINNMGNKGIDKFRKCSVVGQLSAEDEEESDGVGNVKIVQVCTKCVDSFYFVYVLIDLLTLCPFYFIGIMW